MKFIISCPLFIASALALWPQPVTYDHGDTVLFIKRDVPIHWYEVGPRNAGLVEDQQPFLFASNLEPGSDEEKDLKLRQRYVEPSFGDEDDMSEREGISEDEIIDYAIKSTWKTIFEQNLYPWKFHPRDWKEPSPEEHMASVSEINIKLLAQDPQHATKSLTSEVDESYTLTLSEDGKATITANTSIGISHGLTTFTQLFFLHSDSKHVYTPLAPITISDFPKFAHRGINLDVSRNWFSVADIKRQISAAASTKLNVFHLHVTDSQSWPLEIPALPELSAKGAYRPDLVYTPADFRAMQRHAALQGVRMITEIDMPGHTAVIHHAFPDLVAAFDKQDWDTWAAEPPSGTLKLNSSAVDAFLETLFADILPRVAPYARYFHTGGDEVNRNAYTLDDTVKSNDFAVLQPLMQKFIDTNHERVRAAGLTPIVWEEMLLEWNLTLGADVVVQSWRGDEALRGIVERGHRGLAGNYKYWYLDCGKGQWLDFDPSVAANFWPYEDYCAPYHNWRLAYSYDPLNGIPEDKQHLVIGGEAHMWAEQTDPVNVDRMIWPRAAAVAEVLWSGAKDGEGRNRSQIEASPRLSEMRERLVMKGVGAEPIAMPYCTMGGVRCHLGYKGEN